MNILDAEDMIKGLPDQALMQEAQMPSGQMPQFLVVSEIQRRSDMRKRYQAQQQEAMPSVKDQIVQEGIMGMMPQQPMGMPPQGMPPGMPPMGMAQGGIVRMSDGGQAKLQTLMDILAVGGVSAPDLIAQGYTIAEIDAAQKQLRERMSMPVAGMGDALAGGEISAPERAGRMGYGDQYDPPFVRGITDVVADKASDLAGAVERGVESFGIASQKQMPNYGLFGRNDLSLPSISTEEAIDAAKIAAHLSPAGSLVSGVRSVMDSGGASQRISDVYDKSGLGAGIGQFFREIPGAANRTFGAAAYELANLPPIAGAANMLDQLVTGSTDDPLTLGQIFGSGEEEADPQVQAKKSAEVQPAPKVSPFDFTQSPFPTGDPKGEPDATTQLVETVIAEQAQGESPARASYNSAISSIDKLISDLESKGDQESPALDLSDIIGDSRRMAQANALMQLGAGIAGGDLSKGISAAGAAATKGMQDARTLEMKKRLAEYQAGREDIRRGEKRDLDIARLGIQKGQLELMDTRLSNELSKAERVSKGQLFNLVSDLVQEATGDLVTDNKLATVDKLSAYFMQKYAPLLGIDLTKEDMLLLNRTYSGAGTGAAVDPAQFDRGRG